MPNYFSHDYNSRNKPEMQEILMQLGYEGIGVFWVLTEMLYENNGYLFLDKINTYAFSLRTSEDIIKSLIDNFGIFNKDDKYFWSDNILAQIQLIKEKTKQYSEYGKRGAEARLKKQNTEDQATLKPPLSHPQAIKINKINKINKNNTPPTPSLSEGDLPPDKPAVCDFDFQEQFKNFYNNYPNSVKQDESLKNFQETVKTNEDLENFKIAVQNYANQSRDRPRRFVMNSNNFCLQWRDYVYKNSITERKKEQEMAELQEKIKNCHICAGTGFIETGQNTLKQCECNQLFYARSP